jgi:hypothetical protein
VYIGRVKPFHARSAAYDQMLKKNEQMYQLLAIAAALCPSAQKACLSPVQLADVLAEHQHQTRFPGC